LEARERIVKYYLPLPVDTPAPFGVWRDGFGDVKVKAAIAARIARLRGGNLSDSRSVGEGVIELEIDLGPGYRIYFGISGDDIILLCGGDKSTQNSDIVTAKRFWKDYKERTKQNAKKSRLQNRSSRRSSR
jgi:putative addiction module killer protein